MEDHDAVRASQEQTEIRVEFRRLFPLANPNDLPWAAFHIGPFLRDRIRREIEEGTHWFQMRVVKVLCEVSPPKTHVEDMARIVTDQAKKVPELEKRLEIALKSCRELQAERNEMYQHLKDIGLLVGCNHVNDSDGRAKLVRCVSEVLDAARAAAKTEAPVEG